MTQHSIHSTTGLDAFSSAYQKGFRHYEENILMLSSYADKLSTSLLARQPRSMISLGIGHQVVCSKIIQSMSNLLESYTIIEGSSAIIETLQMQYQLPNFVHIQHEFFEKYEPERQVDAIEMGFVLEHVDDPVGLLKRYRTFLSPNGSLYAAVPNAKSLHRMLGHEAGLLEDIYQLSPADRQLGHKRYYDLQTFSNLLRKEKFNIQQISGLLLKPFTTAQIASLQLPPNVLQALCTCATNLPEIANGIMIEATLDRTNE
jgi:trans-aconitate methyltransferase